MAEVYPRSGGRTSALGPNCSVRLISLDKDVPNVDNMTFNVRQWQLMKASAFTILFVAVTAVSQAQSLKSQIQAMDKPIRSAMMKRDINAFEKTVKGGITPDFKYWEDGRSMAFDQMISNMKQGFLMYKKVTKVNTKLMSVKEKGTMGSAVEKHMMEGVITGPDKKSHTMSFVGTSNDTYKKVNGKWKMASMTMKTDKMMMDGKAMNMQAMGQGK
jgi:hypothetical protein